ncbi:MAG: hypothetical protein MJZ10_09075 [Fibrobacter sp.]|nr:hypothetical protein [Fibrobacter sp.]
MKIFLLLFILISLNGVAYCKCIGRIEDETPSGIVLKIQSNQKDRLCWTNSVDYIYQLTEIENDIVVKLLPPTGKIIGNNAKTVWLVEFHRTKQIQKNDYVILEWKNMKKKANYQYDFRRDNFNSVDRIKKGQKLIIDIPCLDEKTAKEARPFNISNPLYPTLRCKIAPADRDYYSK